MRKKLNRLAERELLRKREDGNRVYYEVNQDHPLYSEFHRIVLKTSGLADVLKEALDKAEIRLAFVFGSFARNEEKAASDIDLVLVGSLGFRKVASMLSGMSEQLCREINPHIFTEEEIN